MGQIFFCAPIIGFPDDNTPNTDLMINHMIKIRFFVFLKIINLIKMKNKKKNVKHFYDFLKMHISAWNLSQMG